MRGVSKGELRRQTVEVRQKGRRRIAQRTEEGEWVLETLRRSKRFLGRRMLYSEMVD